MAKDEFELKYDILMKEWDHIQTNIGRLDTVNFQIRGWSTTAITGLIAVSMSQHEPNLMLLAILIVVLFWIIDSLFKSFQRVFILRDREIEEYLSSTVFTEDVNRRQITGIEFPHGARSFGVGSRRTRLVKVAKAAFLRNVLVVYASLTVICILSYFVVQNS
jgi:hypothetical protein